MLSTLPLLFYFIFTITLRKLLLIIFHWRENGGLDKLKKKKLAQGYSASKHKNWNSNLSILLRSSCFHRVLYLSWVWYKKQGVQIGLVLSAFEVSERE